MTRVELTRTLTCAADDLWATQQDFVLDEQLEWVEPRFPLVFDTPFNEGHGQTVDSGFDLEAFFGNTENLPGFPPTSDSSAVISTNATTLGATSSCHGQAYDTSTNPLSWVNGSQQAVHEASLAPSVYDTCHVPVHFFDTYGGLGELNGFVETNNESVSVSSLEHIPRSYSQVSDAVRIPTSGQVDTDANTEQYGMLRPINPEVLDLQFASFENLLGHEKFQHGTEQHRDLVEHASSGQNIWLGQKVSGATPDSSDHTVGTDEGSCQSGDTGRNKTQEISSTSTIELAPIPAAMTKARRRSTAPNADLTLANGMGKFATSRIRKAFSKDRRQEVARTRQVGACFRCKVAKVTVRPFDNLFFEREDVLIVCSALDQIMRTVSVKDA